MNGTSSHPTAPAKKGGTFEELSQEIDRLIEVTSRLESRLAPVLNPPIPTPDTAESVDKANMSLVSELRDRLTYQISRLQELSERIDL